MFLNPCIRCACGKLHVIPAAQLRWCICPACGRDLSRQLLERGQECS